MNALQHNNVKVIGRGAQPMPFAYGQSRYPFITPDFTSVAIPEFLSKV